MTWISDHYFSDAKKEGWFDALLVPAVIIRVQSGLWNMQITAKRPGIRGWPKPYPSFEEWRANADPSVEEGKYGTPA